jgi:hypothetical protein
MIDEGKPVGLRSRCEGSQRVEPGHLNEEPAVEQELLAMLKPCPDDVLKIWPVGRAVGNVKNKGSGLVLPI